MCLFFSSIFTHVEIYFWILRALGATGVFFLWLPKLRITFFTRGRKVYDSQVIFARETSPSWKGKLYVSFYIRNFACKCIPKWISKKIVVLNIFEQFFRQCQAYFLAHFNFFLWNSNPISFHKEILNWNLYMNTILHMCFSLFKPIYFFFSSFFTPSLITITKENVKMLHTNYLRLCLCARKASCNPDNPETSWIQKWYQKSYFCFIISKTILNLDSWILPRGSPCLNFKISNDRVKDLSICSEKFLIENCVS